jgi:hypothetical protein
LIFYTTNFIFSLLIIYSLPPNFFLNSDLFFSGVLLRPPQGALPDPDQDPITSVADPGCLSRIPDPKTATKERGEKKI